MFTEQILKSILSLKSFSATPRARTPALEGIHISVDATNKTITALATDRYVAVRMVITVPEVCGTSWERSVSLATLNAALATVKAGGEPITAFPESQMPEYPTMVGGIIDKLTSAKDAPAGGDFNVKHLSALAKINVGGDKSGRWAIRTVTHGRDGTAMTATALYGHCEVAVAIMGMLTRDRLIHHSQ